MREPVAWSRRVRIPLPAAVDVRWTLRYLVVRTVDSLERINGANYLRSVRNHGTGAHVLLDLHHDEAGDALVARTRPALPAAEIRAMVDRAFDLTADLTAFAKRGGKLLITIGTNDTLASPGAQLACYQALIDRMGRASLDSFARLFVMPGANHGMGGTNAPLDGEGRTIPANPIPNSYDRIGLITDWVENHQAPGRSVTVSGGGRTLPLCSYPEYPKYVQGPVNAAASYVCSGK